MPDVDIDFDERRRVEGIRYVTEEYGATKVAMSGLSTGLAQLRPGTRTAASIREKIKSLISMTCRCHRVGVLGAAHGRRVADRRVAVDQPKRSWGALRTERAPTRAGALA